MVYKLKYHALFTFDLDVNKTDLLQFPGIYIPNKKFRCKQSQCQ